MTIFRRFWKFFYRKFGRNIDLSPEAATLQVSLISLLMLGIVINTAAFFFIENIMVFIKLCVMYFIFFSIFLALRLKLVALSKLQFLTIITIELGLASFWFETKGLLGAVVFTYFMVITLGNTLLPASYHRLLVITTLLIITVLAVIELQFPNYISDPYPSILEEKIFAYILLLIGVVVCGAIITYFKGSYEKAHQKLSERNAKLQKTNRELDNLIYSISHDLRAPIVSVMGLVSLHKDIAETDEAKKYIELEEKALNNLDKFIQDLLAYSRVNRVELQTEVIDLDDLLKEITQQYAFYHEKPIEMRIVSNLQEPFFSDKTKLRIALQNLISNAVNYADFSKPNPYCHINVQKIADNVVIEIADNGIGIDEKHGDKIFDMFYRANVKIKGSGLGLYIVKEAVEKIQGSIEFQSFLHEGTTFRLILPNLNTSK